MPPTIPNTPPLTAAEILKLIDGHPFAFTAYDAQLTATTTWDMNKNTITSDYNYDSKKGSFSITWTIEGDKSCSLSGEGGAKVYQIIYAYQNGFMEVNADGTVHGVSIQK